MPIEPQVIFLDFWIIYGYRLMGNQFLGWHKVAQNQEMHFCVMHLITHWAIFHPTLGYFSPNVGGFFHQPGWVDFHPRLTM